MKTPFLFAFVAAAGTLVAPPATSQDVGYSFTSGTFGDGFNWPRSLPPSRSSGTNGITNEAFFTPDSLGFSHLGSNLAFFDANNLLTRPSTLLSGEVFWTDPRAFSRTVPDGGGGTRLFSASSLGFQDLNLFDGDRFGFDFAAASVSREVPLFFQYQIQDNYGQTARDSFELSGTFQTLGSPFEGRDERLRFEASDFLQLLGTPDFDNVVDDGSLGFNFGDYDPSNPFEQVVNFFDVDLLAFGNNQGVSVNQVAIDNFTRNDGFVAEPRPALVIVNGPTPTPFNPTTFDLTGAGSTNPNVVNVPATTQNGPVGLAVTSGPFTDPGDFQVTLITPGNANVSGLGQVSFGFGQTISSFSAGLFATTDGAQLALTEDVFVDLVGDPGQNGILAAIYATESIVAASEGQLLFDAFAAVGGEPLTVGEAAALGLPTVLGEEDASGEAFFANVSAADFLTLVSLDASLLTVGTQGAAISALLDDNADVLQARVSAWRVIDASGVFTVVADVGVIPEPSSAGLVAAGGLLLTRRRRSGRNPEP